MKAVLKNKTLTAGAGRKPGRSPGWLLGIPVLLFILQPLCLMSFTGEPEIGPVSVEEYQMKAIWLAKVAMFIEWPKTSDVNNPAKPFVIVILGDTPLAAAIHSLYIEGKQLIKEKTVVLKVLSERDNIPPCDLLFISRAAKFRLAKIIAEYEKRPVLIASDTEGFGDRGAHINFVVRNRTLQFEVNNGAMLQAGLTAGYHLSKAATRIINPVEERSNKQ